MKNLLMAVFTLLLAVLIVILMVRGIQIGNFEVLSIGQIIEENENLNTKIENLNTLNNVTYKKNLSDLNEATKKLATSKSAYLDIASVSSDEEIKEANQDKSYAMEYLWSQIGNHATTEGVNIKLTVTSTGVSNKNKLNFTVVGSYIGIRNFLYSLENDSDLNFRIENFKISTGTSEEKLNCTFTVNDIGIKQEQTTTTVQNTSTASQTDSANTADTEKTNTTNTTKDIASSRIDNAVGD